MQCRGRTTAFNPLFLLHLFFLRNFSFLHFISFSSDRHLVVVEKLASSDERFQTKCDPTKADESCSIFGPPVDLDSMWLDPVPHLLWTLFPHITQTYGRPLQNDLGNMTITWSFEVFSHPKCSPFSAFPSSLLQNDIHPEAQAVRPKQKAVLQTDLFI